MAEGFYDYLRRKDPEMMEKLHFRAKVGEFPESRMDLKEEHLPLEEFDTFSDDPLEFEEFTAALAEDVHQIYIFSRILNRFSEKYQSVSLQLEKGLAKLAGCCVTKAILEQKGYTFPMLENLEIKPLYCAVSLNFRKVHAAVKETTNRNYKMWARLIDLEFGWHALAERLKVTEEKIRNIRNGSINVDALIDRIRIFRENRAPSVSDRPRKSVGSGKPYAYPVSGAVIREMTGKSTQNSVPGTQQKLISAGCGFPEKDGSGSGEKDKDAVLLCGGSEKGFEDSSEKFPVSEMADAGPKQYDSIKQRKKAERLARKHARERGQDPLPLPDDPPPEKIRLSEALLPEFAVV